MTDTTINIADEVLAQLHAPSAVLPILVEGSFLSLTAETIPAVAHAAVPDGMHHVDLTRQIDDLATKLQPWRRTGTAKLTDIASLIDWANRHKGPTSALFADTGETPSLTCIADYLGAGEPIMDAISRDPKASHMRHRAVYAFPLSPEWKLWNAVSGNLLDGAEFGEFIEANAKDFLDPTPALLAGAAPEGGVADWERQMLDIVRQLQGKFGQYATLMQLARSFDVYEISNVKATLNRDTGESSIQFVNEHAQPDGQPITIPNLFMVAIPIFENGAAYRIPVRFRYRKAGAGVKFIIQLHNPDIYLRDAVDEALALATEQTELPLFRGRPEAV